MVPKNVATSEQLGGFSQNHSHFLCPWHLLFPICYLLARNFRDLSSWSLQRSWKCTKKYRKRHPHTGQFEFNLEEHHQLGTQWCDQCPEKAQLLSLKKHIPSSSDPSVQLPDLIDHHSTPQVKLGKDFRMYEECQGQQYFFSHTLGWNCKFPPTLKPYVWTWLTREVYNCSWVEELPWPMMFPFNSLFHSAHT